jgi:hypothetical protein
MNQEAPMKEFFLKIHPQPGFRANYLIMPGWGKAEFTDSGLQVTGKNPHVGSSHSLTGAVIAEATAGKITISFPYRSITEISRKRNKVIFKFKAGKGDDAPIGDGASFSGAKANAPRTS